MAYFLSDVDVPGWWVGPSILRPHHPRGLFIQQVKGSVEKTHPGSYLFWRGSVTVMLSHYSHGHTWMVC